MGGVQGLCDDNILLCQKFRDVIYRRSLVIDRVCYPKILISKILFKKKIPDTIGEVGVLLDSYSKCHKGEGLAKASVT